MNTTLIRFEGSGEFEVTFDGREEVYLYQRGHRGWYVRFCSMSRDETLAMDALLARLSLEWDTDKVDGTFTLRDALRIAREILGELK